MELERKEEKRRKRAFEKFLGESENQTVGVKGKGGISITYGVVIVYG